MFQVSAGFVAGARNAVLSLVAVVAAVLNIRVTDSGDVRVTDSGDTRVTS